MTANETIIVAELGKQEMLIIREFDAPRELVFRALIPLSLKGYQKKDMCVWKRYVLRNSLEKEPSSPLTPFSSPSLTAIACCKVGWKKEPVIPLSALQSF